MVGKALALAGVTPEELAEMDNAQSSIVHAVPLPERVHLTRPARKFFGVAQAEQDQHKPWGHAYNLAMWRYVDAREEE